MANVAEGVELRVAGITMPILKLSVARGDEVAVAVASDLALCVVDAESIAEAAVAAGSQGVIAEVHLKVDTGMRRIGCPPEQAPELAKLIDAVPGLRLGGLMSHLPISDSPAGDEFTRAQIELFRHHGRERRCCPRTGAAGAPGQLRRRPRPPRLLVRHGASRRS